MVMGHIFTHKYTNNTPNILYIQYKYMYIRFCTVKLIYFH